MSTTDWQPDLNQAALAQFASYEQPAATTGFSQFAATHAATVRQVETQSLYQRNSMTFTTLAVVIGYLVLAATTGIVLLGILPGMLSIRAVGRGEKLAPLAVIAAVGAVAFSLSVMTHH